MTLLSLHLLFCSLLVPCMDPIPPNHCSNRVSPSRSHTLTSSLNSLSLVSFSLWLPYHLSHAAADPALALVG